MNASSQADLFGQGNISGTRTREDALHGVGVRVVADFPSDRRQAILRRFCTCECGSEPAFQFLAELSEARRAGAQGEGCEVPED